MRAFRLNFLSLVTALITFVSFCAAGTVITTEKCTTRYCGFSTKVYRTTKTVRITTPYTVTKWKTITKPAETVSVTGGDWLWVTVTVTQFTVTDLRTVWIGTSTHTRKFTVTSPTYVITEPITIKTVTPSTVLIPIPSGNFGVNQDPANKAAQTVRKRDVLPAAAGATTYPSAVTCTKTLLTKTGTSDLWKTATKTSGTLTKTLPYSVITLTSTVLARNPKTTIVTTSKYKVAFASSTRTIYTPATWYQTTSTKVVPTPSYYQACGFRNRAPTPEQLQSFVTAEFLQFNVGEYLKTIYSNGTAYDCCVACWTIPQKEGKCLGSIYQYVGPWGPPPCWLTNPNCEDDWPEFDHISECTLILEGHNPGVCATQRYRFWATSSDPPVVLSNGPGCRRFKYYPGFD